MIYKVKTMDAVVTSTGKPMKKLTLEEDGSNNLEQVNIFSDFPHYADIIPGYTIDGETRKNDKGYTNLYSSEVKRGFQKPNFDRIIEKKQAGIAESQEKKAMNIAEAQDRSAWMWAKNNATTLIASDNLKDSSFSSADDMVAEVLKLATKIYLGEPQEPF